MPEASEKIRNEKELEAWLDEHDDISEMSPEFKKKALVTLTTMLTDMAIKAKTVKKKGDKNDGES